METLTTDLQKNRTVKVLKILLWLYIALAVGIAALNYALAPRLPQAQAMMIHRAYQFYENEFKTFLIILVAALGWKLYGTGPGRRMQKANLLAFCISSLLIHIAAPLLSGNPELYYMAMPLPWSTTGLQLMTPDSNFYLQHLPLWGLGGIGAAVVFFIAMNAFVFVGTLLFGRRLQCSSLCLLNGFVAELWAPALPLVGKARKPGKRGIALVRLVRWIFFALSVGLSLWWLFRAAGIQLPGDAGLLGRFEVAKYLSLELMAAMLFWVVWSGRGYCHYCPLGTALSLVARLGRQRIRTDLKRCVSCSACNRSCPMYLGVMEAAQKALPMADTRCVGCGHCVDACPTRTLAYETAWLRWYRSRKAKALSGTGL